MAIVARRDSILLVTNFPPAIGWTPQIRTILICRCKAIQFQLLIRLLEYTYSFIFNTSHGILIREIVGNFPRNPFIPAWSLSKSLLCLLLHPGLKPFLILESNDDVIVTSTEGCCVLYFNLVFE